jgi:hypothetical protein
MVLPTGTLAAGSKTYVVEENVCSASGGDHGKGHLYLRIEMDESGKSGTRKLTMARKAQHRSPNGTWQTVKTWPLRKYPTSGQFFDDAQDHWLAGEANFDPTVAGQDRLLFTMKWWNGNTVLKTVNRAGTVC